MNIMVTSLKRSDACNATDCAPNPAASHLRPTSSAETPGHPQASLLWGHCSFLWVVVHKILLCPPRVYFPVLCKFCQLDGGVNGKLIQENLCHTHTQIPFPCGRALPTHTSTGDAQTQFCLSLCGDSGSWPAQGSFEPSEHLWREWGLILNMNSPLLPSCWGCSFALRHRISPHSRSSVYRLTRFSLTLDVGYLLMAAPSDFGCGFICIVMLIYH